VLAVVIGVVALLVVFAIAAAVVGRETHRLVGEAPRPVFDLDEAVEWVAANLPFDVAAQLTHDEVRRLLTWSLEHFATLGPAGNGDGPASSVVVATGETAGHVLERARRAGLDCTVEQVHAVLDAQLEYLQVIGAMGPPEPPGSVVPEDPKGA
jgi:hypothetical protein